MMCRALGWLTQPFHHRVINRMDLTPASALETINDKQNSRRKIWTATILLDRMGIARSPIPYGKWSKQKRLRAKRVLQELWLAGKLVRKPRPDTRNRYLAGSEKAYLRPEDAGGAYLVPCPKCQSPLVCRDNSIERCPTCDPEQ